jgi:hypothetical protein
MLVQSNGQQVLGCHRSVSNITGMLNLPLRWTIRNMKANPRLDSYIVDMPEWNNIVNYIQQLLEAIDQSKVRNHD